MKYKLLGILCIMTGMSAAWADMFCPTNFNSISMGDSVESVEKACGKPDNKKTYKKTPPQPQEWVYYIAADPNMPGTIKVTVAFDAAGNAINISINGAGVSQSGICGSTQIATGNTTDQIKTACGKPSYINETKGGGDAQTIEMTELQYNSSPPVVLVFKSGALTEKK